MRYQLIRYAYIGFLFPHIPFLRLFPNEWNGPLLDRNINTYNHIIMRCVYNLSLKAIKGF